MCHVLFNRAAENPVTALSHPLSLTTKIQVPVMIQSSQAVFSSEAVLKLNVWH